VIPVRVVVAQEGEGPRRVLAGQLARTCQVAEAASGAEALRWMASGPWDVLLADLEMPAWTTRELLEASRALGGGEVILLARRPGDPGIAEALRLGAFGWLERPFDPEGVARLVARAAARHRLRAERPDPCPLPGVVGRGARSLALCRALSAAAENDLPLLLVGEAGTGRRLAARTVHYRSPRRERRLLSCDCGAPGEDAAARCVDRLEEAAVGALLLEDVAALPLPAQDALLDRLRAGEGVAPMAARLFATSDVDLAEEVRAGRFRERLHRLLASSAVLLPPLRERVEDLPSLAACFLERSARALRREIPGFEAEALRALCAAPWPGNVAELEQVVDAAVAACPSGAVELHHLPPAFLAARAAAAPAGPALAALPYREAMEAAQERASREYLVALLQRHRGNVSRAAAGAGLERESLHRLLRKAGIRPGDYRSSPGRGS